MNTEKRNSFGLFDAPVRLPEKERITLSPEDIERQLDAGAFLMSREEATLQRYMQFEEMQRKGIEYFDAWASTFGQITNGW